MTRTRREWLFALALATLCIGLLFIDLAPPSRDDGSHHARALITEVDNSRVLSHQLVRTEFQALTVRLLDGPYQGRELKIINQLTGNLEFDEFYEADRQILVEYGVTNGEPVNGMARGHYRLHLQGLLIGLYVALLVIVAGVTGLKAALSFIFAAIVLWKLFFPMLLMGYPPLMTGLGIVALLTAAVTFSVGGLNRRGTATFLGSMMGVLLTCGLAIWFTDSFQLQGAVRPFAQALFSAGNFELNLTHIFIASVFIACSGAVMDLAMDIAAAMEEIKLSNPDIGLFAHIASGLRVGRAVVGTMTTTLLLAYSSSHIFMFLLVMAKGLPMINILNAPFVSAEILNILVGSFGLVTVAPFTALIAGLIYHFDSEAKSD